MALLPASYCRNTLVRLDHLPMKVHTTFRGLVADRPPTYRQTKLDPAPYSPRFAIVPLFATLLTNYLSRHTIKRTHCKTNQPGYCYLRLFRQKYRTTVRSVLGLNPHAYLISIIMNEFPMVVSDRCDLDYHYHHLQSHVYISKRFGSTPFAIEHHFSFNSSATHIGMNCSSLPSNPSVPSLLRCAPSPSYKSGGRSSLTSPQTGKPLFRDGYYYLNVKDFRLAQKMATQCRNLAVKNEPLPTRYVIDPNTGLREKNKNGKPIYSAAYKNAQHSKAHFHDRYINAVKHNAYMHNSKWFNGSAHSAYLASVYKPLALTKASDHNLLHLTDKAEVKVIPIRYAFDTTHKDHRVPHDPFLRQYMKANNVRAPLKFDYSLKKQYLPKGSDKLCTILNRHSNTGSINYSALNQAIKRSVADFRHVKFGPLTYDQVINSKPFLRTNDKSKGFSGPGFATKQELAKDLAFRAYANQFAKSSCPPTFLLHWKAETIKTSKLLECPRPIIASSVEHEILQRMALQKFNDRVAENRFHPNSVARIGIRNQEFGHLFKNVHHLPKWLAYAIDFSRQDSKMPRAISDANRKVMCRLAEIQKLTPTQINQVARAVENSQKFYVLPNGQTVSLELGFPTGQFNTADGNTVNHNIVHNYIDVRLGLPHHSPNKADSGYGDDWLRSLAPNSLEARLFTLPRMQTILTRELDLPITHDVFGKHPSLGNRGTELFLKRGMATFSREPIPVFNPDRVMTKWLVTHTPVKTAQESWDRSYGYLLLTGGNPKLFATISNYLNWLSTNHSIQVAQSYQKNYNKYENLTRDFFTNKGNPVVEPKFITNFQPELVTNDRIHDPADTPSTEAVLDLAFDKSNGHPTTDLNASANQRLMQQRSPYSTHTLWNEGISSRYSSRFHIDGIKRHNDGLHRPDRFGHHTAGSVRPSYHPSTRHTWHISPALTLTSHEYPHNLTTPIDNHHPVTWTFNSLSSRPTTARPPSPRHPLLKELAQQSDHLLKSYKLSKSAVCRSIVPKVQQPNFEQLVQSFETLRNLRHLLLQCGDIEINPGPNRNFQPGTPITNSHRPNYSNPFRAALRIARAFIGTSSQPKVLLKQATLYPDYTPTKNQKRHRNRSGHIYTLRFRPRNENRAYHSFPNLPIGMLIPTVTFAPPVILENDTQFSLITKPPPPPPPPPPSEIVVCWCSIARIDFYERKKAQIEWPFKHAPHRQAFSPAAITNSVTGAVIYYYTCERDSMCYLSFSSIAECRNKFGLEPLEEKLNTHDSLPLLPRPVDTPLGDRCSMYIPVDYHNQTVIFRFAGTTYHGLILGTAELYCRKTPCSSSIHKVISDPREEHSCTNSHNITSLSLRGHNVQQMGNRFVIIGNTHLSALHRFKVIANFLALHEDAPLLDCSYFERPFRPKKTHVPLFLPCLLLYHDPQSGGPTPRCYACQNCHNSYHAKAYSTDFAIAHNLSSC